MIKPKSIFFQMSPIKFLPGSPGSPVSQAKKLREQQRREDPEYFDYLDGQKVKEELMDVDNDLKVRK